MLRIATIEDIPFVSKMYMEMYKEIFPDAVPCINPYYTTIEKFMKDPKKFIYVDEIYRGFIVVFESIDPLRVGYKAYIGESVYIIPQFRNGRLLKSFYDTLFAEFPEGDILGFTEINSRHIPVMEKRHTRIMNCYKLNRSI